MADDRLKVTRVEVGDEYTESADPPTSGCFRATATEPGYSVSIKYAGTVFVSDEVLRNADRARGEKREPASPENRRSAPQNPGSRKR